MSRNSRPNLGGTGIVCVNPADPADTRVMLAQDVNDLNRNAGGVITAGALAGSTFNPDGTLRPFRGPNAQGTAGRTRSACTTTSMPRRRSNATTAMHG